MPVLLGGPGDGARITDESVALRWAPPVQSYGAYHGAYVAEDGVPIVPHAQVVSYYTYDFRLRFCPRGRDVAVPVFEAIAADEDGVPLRWFHFRVVCTEARGRLIRSAIILEQKARADALNALLCCRAPHLFVPWAQVSRAELRWRLRRRRQWKRQVLALLTPRPRPIR